MTQQIKALEDEFGVPLFDRGGGHIALTAGGKALLPFAEKMKELSDEAVASVAEAFGQQAGALSLGASQTIGQYLLPKFVAEFRRTNPKIRVTARSGNTDEMIEALLAREIHLALIEGPEQRKDLRIEPFMEDHMILVVPANHGWANHEVELEDLRSEPLLMREFGSGSRRVVEQALSKAGAKTKDLTISMELGLDRRPAECGRSRPWNHLRLPVGCPKSTLAGNVKDRESPRTETVEAILDGVSGRSRAHRYRRNLPDISCSLKQRKWRQER